jgi:hypothetical protein
MRGWPHHSPHGAFSGVLVSLPTYHGVLCAFVNDFVATRLFNGLETIWCVLLSYMQIMSDLKSDYREIEEGLNWSEKPNGIGKDEQFYRLVMDLKVKVRERSLSEQLDPSVYEDRLYKLLDFVSDLRSALNHHSVT